MTIRYIARTWIDHKIESVLIDRETDKSIWVRGTKIAKESNGQCVFNTFQEAKNFLTTHLKEEIENREKSIDTLRSKLKLIEDLEDA